MRIAMLSPIAWRTPPRHYGPWESIVSLLTEGLVERRIDVTLFATRDSQTRGKLLAVCPKGYEEDKSIEPKVWECLHISKLFERGDEFDLIHNHFDFLPLTYIGMTTTPVLTTIHGFSSPKILPVYKKYDERAYYVSISDADRSPELTYVATIHHGIDLSLFSFRPEPGDYLLFFGRIHHDKGAKEAIEISRRAGKKLVMAGIVQDEDYFNREVVPYLDEDNVVYIGSAGAEKRNELLGGAFALLHPINFDEPFGLSVIEAMACGTPVVAFKRGSMSEVITDGRTGFLVSSVEVAARKLGQISDLERAECRRWVETRFSAERMVNDYIRVYERILEEHKREDRQPWGYYRVLAARPDHKVRKIVIYPGHDLSLQRHRLMIRHWHIVQGQATLTRGDEEVSLSAGQSVDLVQGTWNRIINSGGENLVFIEIQTDVHPAKYDIEQLEDEYGRIEPANRKAL